MVNQLLVLWSGDVMCVTSIDWCHDRSDNVNLMAYPNFKMVFAYSVSSKTEEWDKRLLIK